MSNPDPAPGTIFNDLKFLSRATADEAKDYGLVVQPFTIYWWVECILCGAKTVKQAKLVRHGLTKSCSCLRRTKFLGKKHPGAAKRIKDQKVKEYGPFDARLATDEELQAHGVKKRHDANWLLTCPKCGYAMIRTTGTMERARKRARKRDREIVCLSCRAIARMKREIPKNHDGLVPIRPANRAEILASKWPTAKVGTLWRCRCPHCGEEVIRHRRQIVLEKVKSCGCLPAKLGRERGKEFHKNGQLFNKKRRKCPAEEHHTQWKQWSKDGLSHGQIQKKHLAATGESLTRDAIRKAIKRA